jgi:hypothetical protein
MKNQLVESGQVYQLAKKEDLICCVIAVSNQNLSPKIAEIYPEMVTYVNHKGDIRSMPLVEFQSRWEPTGETVERLEYLDQAAADHMASFIAGDDSAADTANDDADDADGDVEDVDAVDATNIPAFNAGFSSDETGEETDEETMLNVGPHSLKSALETNFLSYAESPEQGMLVHKLEFLLQDGLTFDAISLAFTPDSPECIDVFSVGDIRVDWEVFSGVYPTVQPGLGKIATVFLKTSDAALGINNAEHEAPAAEVASRLASTATAPAPAQTLTTVPTDAGHSMPGNGAAVETTGGAAPTFTVN